MKRINDKEISSLFLKKTQKELGDTSTLNSPKDGTSISSERLSANDIMNLARDPGKRKKINNLHPDDRDIVRREYAQKGPCQPKSHEFPITIIGGKKRRFVRWYEKHKSWIEYSVEKDAAFCFVCYLFKKENAPGGDAFILGGFRAWNRFDNAFLKHFGDHMSLHNKALKSLIDFDNQKASTPSGFYKQSEDSKSAYRMRLEASVESLKWLLLQGWESHMLKVTLFMGKNNIDIPIMEGNYVVPGRRKFRGRMTQVTNLHHFRVEVYLSVLDLQLQELENRFPEVSKELLICMSCFHPYDRFSAFDTVKLIRLAELYPSEFSSTDLLFIEHSLANFISDVQNDERFLNLKNLNELSIKLCRDKEA